MNFTETKTLSKNQKLGLIKLWNNEYPKALSRAGLAEFDHILAEILDGVGAIFTEG